MIGQSHYLHVYVDMLIACYMHHSFWRTYSFHNFRFVNVTISHCFQKTCILPNLLIIGVHDLVLMELPNLIDTVRNCFHFILLLLQIFRFIQIIIITITWGCDIHVACRFTTARWFLLGILLGNLRNYYLIAHNYYIPIFLHILFEMYYIMKHFIPSTIYDY